MDKWINTMWYFHPMDYYSAIKKAEVLTDITAWMNLENTILMK